MFDLGDTEARPLVCAITMSQEAAASCADIERDCVERSRPVIDLGDTEARPLVGEITMSTCGSKDRATRGL